MSTVGGGGLSETMCCLLITHDFSDLHEQTERCPSSGLERQMVKKSLVAGMSMLDCLWDSPPQRRKLVAPTQWLLSCRVYN